MTITADKWIEDVRVAIDMNSSDGNLLVNGDDSDTLELNSLIRSKMAAAACAVEMEAPYYLLEQGHNFRGATTEAATDGSGNVISQDSIKWNTGETKGWLLLPDDFMRLVTFRMSDWSRPVFQPISADSPLYSRQSSPFIGICGSPDNPVCAVVNRSEGLSLEFYSCKSSSATIAQAVYIPNRVLRDGAVDISPKCYTAAVYHTAFLVLASLNESLSSTMLEISKTYLR